MRKGLLVTALALLMMLTVLGGCKAPAKFEVTSLEVMPREVIAGEAVNVTAEVENTGGSEGTYTAVLTVDGVEVERKDIVITAGAAGTVTFSLVENASGSYQIGVGELSSTLVVSEVMTIGDFISKVVIEEYQKAIEGKEPTLKEGTAVRVLGSVERLTVAGEHPQFTGKVYLKPYYCWSRVECLFEGEAVGELTNLQIEQDVIIEGTYGGVKHFDFSRDVYYLSHCSVLFIEGPRAWTIPIAEEMKACVMTARYFSKYDVQSEFGKGERIRIFGPVHSVKIGWGYLEGIWGDLLVSELGICGTICRFRGEKVHEITGLPEEQQVIVEGEYDHGSANYAYLDNCSVIYP